MNFNPETGEVELHKHQQAALRKAKNICDFLAKLGKGGSHTEIAAANLGPIIAKFCTEPEADQRGPEGKGASK